MTLTETAGDAAGAPGNDATHHRRGLIALVGLKSADAGSDLALVAALGDRLERVALIGTRETAAAGIDDKVTSVILPAYGHRLPASSTRVWSGTVAQSMAEHELAVTETIRWMTSHGLDACDIVVDVTAGRKSAMAGAIVAALRHDPLTPIEVQLVDNAWNPVAGVPVPDRRAIKLLESIYPHGGDTTPVPASAAAV